MATARATDRGSNGSNGSKWIRPEKRRRIYCRDRHRCVWCTKDLSRSSKVRRTLDHVRPRSWPAVWYKSGPYRLTPSVNHHGNLVTACLRCNARRGGLSAVAFAWTFPSPDIVLERIAQALETPLPELPA